MPITYGDKIIDPSDPEGSLERILERSNPSRRDVRLLREAFRDGRSLTEIKTQAYLAAGLRGCPDELRGAYRRSPVPVRVGISWFGAYLQALAFLQNPGMLSANALWRPGRGFPSLEFSTGGKKQPWRGFGVTGAGVALDSGGFNLMWGKARQGKQLEFDWSVDEYMSFAIQLPADWFASMDYPCEPALVGDQAGVRRHVRKTVESYAEGVRWIEDLTEEGYPWLGHCREVSFCVPRYVPVIQGWAPEDYLGCVDLYEGRGVFDEWPDLVGIGSMCSRSRNTGEGGVLPILEALDRRLPPHVRWHLFGLKGDVLPIVAQRFGSRVASTDSMAWSSAQDQDWKKLFKAYRHGRGERPPPKDLVWQLPYLWGWLARQYTALGVI